MVRISTRQMESVIAQMLRMGSRMSRLGYALIRRQHGFETPSDRSLLSDFYRDARAYREYTLQRSLTERARTARGDDFVEALREVGRLE